MRKCSGNARCKTCGKRFYADGCWGWRMGDSLFCSYACMRKAEARAAEIYHRQMVGPNSAYLNGGEESLRREKARLTERLDWMWELLTPEKQAKENGAFEQMTSYQRQLAAQRISNYARNIKEIEASLAEIEERMERYAG